MSPVNSGNGEMSVSAGGDNTIPVANATVVAGGNITTKRGRLCKVLVTTVIGANSIIITDGPAGTIIGIVPNATAVGTVLTFDMPVLIGITFAAAAGGGAVTLSVF